MAKDSKEKPLTHNQKLLHTLMGEQSCRDWRENLGNERLRMSRVMVAKLIRTGDEDVLDIVAEYLGTRIVRDSVVQEEQEKLMKLYPGHKAPFDVVRERLMKR